ncbi:MAG: RIO1 family regulatory kinase/ATPase, partial [Candidatus Bathyarchaeia archaeon]
FRITELPSPEEILDEILENVRRAYIGAGVIHGDLSEFNVIINPDWHILIIDWPQYVRVSHPNAEMLLKRDLSNILKFFRRKYGLIRELEETLNYIKRP